MAVLLLRLHFFTKYPDCVNNTINIFQFPNLSLSAGSKAAMVTRIWGTALYANTIISYANTAAIMKQQRIPPIVGLEASENMLEQWLVMVTVLLGPQERHPEFFGIETLLAAADKFNSRLQSQAAVQQDMQAALIRLIQTEFNESFRQAFTSHIPVHWTQFTPLIRTLTTGNFHPGTVTMPGGFRKSLPTTVAPHQSAGPHHKNSTTPYR